jgi:hypothetical protein
VAFLSLLWITLATVARAQSAPQMQVQVEQDTVGVGDVVHVQLVVQSGEGRPSDPTLGASPGFAVRNVGSSPSETHININGNRIDRFGLTVDWALQARQVGTFRVGPFGIAVGGARFQTGAVQLKVVPAGQAPPRAPPQVPTPFGFSPFDPWRGVFPGMPGMDPDDRHPPQAPPPVTADPKLALDAPRGASYFLHATVDKTSAVVGEQVTFSVYEYIDVAAMGLELDDEASHDATAADFVKHPLMREDQDAVSAGYASIAGRTWAVKLVRRWALFPLHGGDLAIGPMAVVVARPRSSAGKRTTEEIHVQVTEPPASGRPPGYSEGDVGRFRLTADASPRELEQGGAVAVHAELSGTGNLPSSLATPGRDGVEWLEPQVHEVLGPQDHERFGGKRTFDFVVRLKRAGSVDLGELRLPFWDPEARRYDVARAALGSVTVKPSAAAVTDAAPREVLANLPPVRLALEGSRGPRAHADDTAPFWIFGVLGWPGAFGLVFAGSRAARRVSRAWRERRTSPAAELRQRMAAAQSASSGADVRDADAATVRALHAATVAYAGVNVRGASGGGDVIHRLTGAGVPGEAAATVAELLVECESARFAPDAPSAEDARKRWSRARQAIGELERGMR